jgi:hypothetical protein
VVEGGLNIRQDGDGVGDEAGFGGDVGFIGETGKTKATIVAG